jgi:uncharacterized membrane protein
MSTTDKRGADSRSTLPPQHAEHAETVVAIRARAENQLSLSQRLVEAFTARIGRPSTILFLLFLIGIWMSWNAGEIAQGKHPIDPPPFFWLQGAIALYAALITTFVLATQNREKRHNEQRAYLELQVNLLAEQKTAKIIELLEELRRDMPTVRDRVDRQADAMQQPVDTVAVLNTLHAMELELEERAAESKEPDEE